MPRKKLKPLYGAPTFKPDLSAAVEVLKGKEPRELLSLGSLPPGVGIRSESEARRFRNCKWKLSKAERFGFEGPGLLMMSAEVVGQDLGMSGGDVVRLLEWAGFGVIQIGRRVLVNRRQVELLLFSLTWGGLVRRVNPETGKDEEVRAFNAQTGLDGEWLGGFKKSFMAYSELMKTVGYAYRRLLKSGKWRYVEEGFQDLLKIPLEDRSKHQAVVVRMFRELGLNPDYPSGAGEEATRIEYEGYRSGIPAPLAKKEISAVGEARAEREFGEELGTGLDSGGEDGQNEVPDGVDDATLREMRDTLTILDRGFNDPEALYEQQEEPAGVGRKRPERRKPDDGGRGGVGGDHGPAGGSGGDGVGGGPEEFVGPGGAGSGAGPAESESESFEDFGDETGTGGPPAHRPPTKGTHLRGISDRGAGSAAGTAGTGQG